MPNTGELVTHSTVNHVQDLRFDQFQVLGVAGRCSADHIINLDIIIFTAHTPTIHSVRELHENRMLFHDTLDVLATDTNNAFMILVWDME